MWNQRGFERKSFLCTEGRLVEGRPHWGICFRWNTSVTSTMQLSFWTGWDPWQEWLMTCFRKGERRKNHKGQCEHVCHPETSEGSHGSYVLETTNIYDPNDLTTSARATKLIRAQLCSDLGVIALFFWCTTARLARSHEARHRKGVHGRLHRLHWKRRMKGTAQKASRYTTTQRLHRNKYESVWVLEGKG